MAVENPHQWWTPPEVAEHWQVPVRRVRNWIRRGRVTSRRDGRVDALSVGDYLARRGDDGLHDGAPRVGEDGQARDSPRRLSQL